MIGPVGVIIVIFGVTAVVLICAVGIMVWRVILRQKHAKRKQRRITPSDSDTATAAASGEGGRDYMNHSEPSGSRRVPRNDARQACHTSNTSNDSSSGVSDVTQPEKRDDEVASEPEKSFDAQSPPPSYESYHTTTSTARTTNKSTTASAGAGMPLSERRSEEAASSATRAMERGAAHGSAVLSPPPSNESHHGAENSNRAVAGLPRPERRRGAKASAEKTASIEGHGAHHESEVGLLSPPRSYYVYHGRHKTEEGIFLTI